MLRKLVTQTRSYRRFHQDSPVPMEQLDALVDLARHAASGANLQPLKYVLCNDPALNARIYPLLTWAGYLKDWDGPAEGERPAAYVVILNDTTIRPEPGVDPGIAAQTMMLGATELGLGGCMIGSVNRPALRELLELPDRYKVSLVLALGKPKETVVLEKLAKGGDIRYYREADGTHHVPKRTLGELVLARHGG